MSNCKNERQNVNTFGFGQTMNHGFETVQRGTTPYKLR